MLLLQSNKSEQSRKELHILDMILRLGKFFLGRRCRRRLVKQ